MNPYPNQPGYQYPPFGGNPNAPYPTAFSSGMPIPDYGAPYSQQPMPSGYPMMGMQPYPNSGMASNYPLQPPAQMNYNPQYPPNQQYQPNPSFNNYAQPQVYPNIVPNTVGQFQYPQQASNIASNIIQPNLPQALNTNAIKSTSVLNTIYPNCEGTVKAIYPFDPADDAKKLYKAMKGIGTNETVLIDIICKRTNQQRLEIASHYKTAYGKALLTDVMSETSGKFHDVLRALLLPTIEFEANEVKDAVRRLGTDENALIDIFCTKTNAEMRQLRAYYKNFYNTDLEGEVRADVSGYFQRIMVSLINGNRSEAQPDLNKAKLQAQELYNAGVKRLGTDEVKFNEIFACESYAHLRVVFDEYYKLTGHDIEKAIKSEMSGDVEAAFLAIAKFTRNPQGYFAERIYESMKGAGTNDRTLIRNIVLRCEIDMREIKIEFQKRYSKPIESFIKSDCSGDYKRALLCLVGDQNWK